MSVKYYVSYISRSELLTCSWSSPILNFHINTVCIFAMVFVFLIACLYSWIPSILTIIS